MAELEIFFPYPNSKYGDGIILEEWHDRLSLVVGSKSQEGTVYKKWVFPQTKDREPASKAIPWKVQLGSSREEAIDMLKNILMELGVDMSDDGVPF